MTTLKNARLIKALLRQPVDRTPVWMMRQAGRYLPEYRKLRAFTPDFMSFCKTPELACEATLQPLARFPLDAAIVFSDILTIPDAMAVDLRFQAGEGPVIHRPIRQQRDVDHLRMPEVEKDLDYVMQAIRQILHALDGKVPLIGFAGSPWTLAAYMVEGSGSRVFPLLRSMLYREPNILKTLLGKLTDITIDYLNAQIAAGVQALMVFDTWGGLLSTQAYQEFSLSYLQRIAASITREVNGQRIPLVFFTKQGGPWLELIAASGCDAISLDWTIDIENARERVGDRVALQGNLDPFSLFASPEKIRQETQTILEAYGSHPGHVFNLGHGIDKNTPIEGVSAMIDAVYHYHSVHQGQPVL